MRSINYLENRYIKHALNLCIQYRLLFTGFLIVNLQSHNNVGNISVYFAWS